MNNYAVIFDMDGVIAHTNPYHAEAFETFFGKYNIPFTHTDLEEHVFGRNNSYVMRHFFDRDISNEEFLLLEEEKEALFRKIYQDQVKSIAGFRPFLAELRRNSFKTGIATSAPIANLDLIADRLDIRRHMDSILSAEDVTKHKPDPQVYLRSAQNLQLKPEQCLVFEDSAAGITAGQKAGMQVVAVLSTHRKEQLPPCNFYINDYNDIKIEDVQSLLKR